MSLISLVTMTNLLLSLTQAQTVDPLAVVRNRQEKVATVLQAPGDDLITQMISTERRRLSCTPSMEFETEYEAITINPVTQ